ncbi:tyrosine-type recombinase/integrase [Lachnoclostridium sp. Marseille-P6806]|uniref:tyrosine-type recombinase/integrase n=1 Tax=Lachnoclostridium sp. Marseille-P6806 TaxID=2364793 RepID=UPI00103090E1|nr:tyrosine-type recombinase/integrase [Lachnoclostridium sp. Marseille-P6806]
MIRKLTEETLQGFVRRLSEEEKSAVTIEKYLRDARAFLRYMGGCTVTRERVIGYKKALQNEGYAPASINSMLASLHKLFGFLCWKDCCVRTLRIQKPVYCPVERELTREEYFRLLQAAEKKPRLSLVLQTLGSTGIRISELCFFTVEAVRKGSVTVSCKNKMRTVLLPVKLRRKLLLYARSEGIREGILFRTRGGRPLDRSNVWSEMKRLCLLAKVNPSKVYPHSLRRLFARAFYQIKRDLVRLADILGHSTVNTTRIYLVSSGREHLRLIEKLRLVT